MGAFTNCVRLESLYLHATTPPSLGDYALMSDATGAYNYTMASNYNRIPRPAVVMLKDGADYLAVKRETFEDICRLDI